MSSVRQFVFPWTYWNYAPGKLVNFTKYVSRINIVIFTANVFHLSGNLCLSWNDKFFLEGWMNRMLVFQNWFSISLNNKANLKNILHLMDVLKHDLLMEGKRKSFLTHLKKQIFLSHSRVIIINWNFKILNYEKYLILGSSCEFKPIN